MDKKQIANRLSKNLLLTFFFSSWLTFISIFICYSKQVGSLEGNSGITIMILAGICWILVLTVSSTTVFLNLIDKVMGSKLFCFLTFFFLPSSVAVITFTLSDFQDMWQPFSIVTLPFLFTQTYFYIKFLKEVYNPLLNN